MAKILVVDDEPDIVDIIRFYLQTNGYAVVCAADGPAALARVFADTPDLILLDVRMPGMSGFEVLQQLKADARTAQTPVILLTARADMPAVTQGWNLGADNYVTKPFDLNELARIVQNVLAFRGKIRVV